MDQVVAGIGLRKSTAGHYAGDDQTLFVGGQEFRIPGNGREYEIPVKLTGRENSVVTQVWPYDKPKVRQFKLSDGKLESRFDITLQPVR